MTIQDKAPVNWVSRRASCTIDDVFQALLRRVEQDVTEIDRIRNDSEVWTIDRITSASEIYTRDGESPHVKDLDLYEFTVKGPTELGHTPKAQFLKEGHFIRVSNTTKNEFVIVPKWDHEATECRLVVDDKSLDLWQISQRALYPLFFKDRTHPSPS